MCHYCAHVNAKLPRMCQQLIESAYGSCITMSHDDVGAPRIGSQTEPITPKCDAEPVASAASQDMFDYSNQFLMMQPFAL